MLGRSSLWRARTVLKKLSDGTSAERSRAAGATPVPAGRLGGESRGLFGGGGARGHESSASERELSGREIYAAQLVEHVRVGRQLPARQLERVPAEGGGRALCFVADEAAAAQRHAQRQLTVVPHKALQRRRRP